MEPLKTGRVVADLGTVVKDDRKGIRPSAGPAASGSCCLRRHTVKYRTVRDGENAIENAGFRHFPLVTYKEPRTRALLPSDERELNDLSHEELHQKSLRCNLSSRERFLLSDLRGYSFFLI